MRKIVNFFKTLGMLFATRALPIATFAILFAVVAVQIDRWQLNNAPATDFINYTAFDVQNARAGEDVYFKVCRDHEENYTYAGALTVYIYRDADPKGTPTKVYARDIGGSIRTECENKVLRAADFRHDPGTYKMAFCINFEVKYSIQKTACRDSNIYKIYPQPTDIQQQLKYYQDQIDILNRQLKDRGVEGAADSMQTPAAAPRSVSPNSPTANASPQPQQAPQQTPSTPTRVNPIQPAAPVQQEPCGLNLGVGLFCGSDGLIRL